MTVTDDHVHTLEAQLAGRTEEHRRRLDQLDPGEDNRGYSALIAAGLLVAIERRFIKDGKYLPRTDVIDYVATLRASSQVAANALDPQIAERIILFGMEQGDIDDIDDNTVLGHQMFLLAALVSDEGFNAHELGTFLTEAREVADQWLTQ
ncbi:hypothetical protein E1200_12805 [Actinomadura sp. GC306]|uniref:hypothetical protein n=1 Tax=Actinomadura sp. GC306 TaxID=2530367 RepID=UPI00104F4679|nr:hypothetical protein [Actinomadura sp. GC306]TDC68086.1 hypothetical protein E1200_12805 [Actinomadura sp. GC306]